MPTHRKPGRKIIKAEVYPDEHARFMALKDKLDMHAVQMATLAIREFLEKHEDQRVTV